MPVLRAAIEMPPAHTPADPAADGAAAAPGGRAAEAADPGAGAASEVRPGHLYVVATPIGNLGDLSPRALRVLGAVGRVCAEDTRTSGALLAHFGVKARFVALHDHNEDALAGSLVAALQSGESLALVSDAGTPAVADPGFALVRAARAAGVPVVAVPGPSAALAALSVSGLPSDEFLFAGFLPPRSAARSARWRELGAQPRSVIVFESGHRIEDSLRDCVATLGGERMLCLARELTKRFEQSLTAPAGEVLAWLQADPHRRLGEFVLVLAPAPAPAQADAHAHDAVLQALLAELEPSRAARVAAVITGARRNALYQRALALAPQSRALAPGDEGGPDPAP